MEKIKKGTAWIILFVMILIPKLTNAASSKCSSEEQIQLQKDALGVQMNYEAGMFGTGEYEVSEGDTEETEIEVPKVKVSLYNLTESVYVKVTGSDIGEQIYYYEDMDDGEISWFREDLSEIVNYEVKVYSNMANCEDEEYRNFTVVTPMINENHYQPYCNDVNEYYCDEFVTQKINLTDKEIELLAEEEKKNKEEKPQEEQKKDYTYAIWIGIGFLVVVMVAAIVIIIRKQREKVL